MSKTIEEALRAAAVKTMQELCFNCPSEDVDEVQAEAPLEAEARVSFTGPFDGEMTLRLYGEVLAEMAAGMQGGWACLTPALEKDALKELANVICGNVLPLISGPMDFFRLDAPRVVLGKESLSGQQPQVVVRMGLARGRAEVGFRRNAV